MISNNSNAVRRIKSLLLLVLAGMCSAYFQIGYAQKMSEVPDTWMYDETFKRIVWDKDYTQDFNNKGRDSMGYKRIDINGDGKKDFFIFSEVIGCGAAGCEGDIYIHSQNSKKSYCYAGTVHEIEYDLNKINKHLKCLTTKDSM